MAKNSRKHQAITKNNFVEELYRDISSFKVLLGKHMGGQISDLSGLEAAIASIKKDQQEKWRYEVKRLTFTGLYLTRDGVTDGASIEITMRIGGPCIENRSVTDLLNEYCLEFLIKQKSEQSIELKNAFRFERHIYEEGDETPEFIHPVYHLQYGGDKLTDDEEFEKGHMLFTPAPRIMYPPMDIILAIDFVLGNYYSAHKCEDYKRLVKDYEYKQIVCRSQKRFWQPFFLGTLSYFAPGKNSVYHFNSEKIDPHYAKNLFLYAKDSSNTMTT